MEFLKLNKDIEFKQFDRNTAEYRFAILDREAVDKFLAQADLINFLTDPYTINQYSAGCRLRIEIQGNELVIARQIGSTTFLLAAFRDVLAAMFTYIMPKAQEDAYPAWRDMVSDFYPVNDGVPTKDLPRGVKFLAPQAAIENKVESTL